MRNRRPPPLPSPESTSLTRISIARRVCPGGSGAGQRPRRRGVAPTKGSDARCTPPRRASQRSQGLPRSRRRPRASRRSSSSRIRRRRSSIATPGSPIGWPAGRTRRRAGAAKRATRAARSTLRLRCPQRHRPRSRRPPRPRRCRRRSWSSTTQRRCRCRRRRRPPPSTRTTPQSRRIRRRPRGCRSPSLCQATRSRTVMATPSMSAKTAMRR
mmetsp:Transcript_44105/g.116681  ORF Transcript_44105/g.116681 Transcript_44105/m.116681 type:complete len:213 (-) Transcript_44105:1548-2186(-)